LDREGRAAEGGRREGEREGEREGKRKGEVVRVSGDLHLHILEGMFNLHGTKTEMPNCISDAYLYMLDTHLASPTHTHIRAEDKRLLAQLTPYLDTLGMTCPMLKVYIATGKH
jgi:hypothetical protein